ncbi:PAS domain-containing hybrid sensor histidine kinase/response regulator [Aliiglaciecola litoralis]|uniref:histidine kinase n=1 Tax=Aliiglaciecola litoralis TaxID=582857 RepID=A0ABN1LQQ5_9ALTE
MNKVPDLAVSFEQAACGLVTTETTGTIVRANQTFCKWLGFDVDELLEKKKIQELFTVGGRFFHHTHWAPLLQLQGSVAEVQMDLVGRDGQTVPMLINVVRQQFGDTSYDQLAFFVAEDRKKYERELLSARRSAEDALTTLRSTQKKLQESRDFMSIAIRIARMGVWSQDIKTGQMWWSQELQQLAGLGDTEYWGASAEFYDLVHPDDRQEVIDELQKSINTKSDYDIQFRMMHRDGHWLSMEGRGHATYSDNDQAISIFGIFIDISERKAAEEQLRELNDQLSVADRRKDEFLATLGHELRNPLAPIRNVLEVMRLKEPENSFLQWSRDMIERHVTQMTHLVDDLMETSRITHGRIVLRKEHVNILELIQCAVESSQEIMQKFNHKFTVELPDSPIFIDADSTRFIQIVSNLLTNAAKYTPKGGIIQLRVFQAGTEVVVSVQDSGIGIPATQLSTVFNMFSQLAPAIERSQGGLGIGLALVHGLVRLHNGSIVAQSEGVGKGSEFIVRLPISDKAVDSSPAADETVAVVVNSKRILVIEDNIDAAESLTMLLQISGHTTQSAHDGKSGITMAEEFAPDVILMDIGLPDINGYQVAQQIRQQTWGKGLFLIAATGWGQDKDKDLAKKAGFDYHLTKPINFQELNALLQKID